MKCAIIPCNLEANIKYEGAIFCEPCYLTLKMLETSEYQLGDK